MGAGCDAGFCMYNPPTHKLLGAAHGLRLCRGPVSTSMFWLMPLTEVKKRKGLFAFHLLAEGPCIARQLGCLMSE